MPRPAKPDAVKNTSVTLEPEVLSYLETLRGRSQRSRSWLINHIVKQHQRQQAELARERARRQADPLLLDAAGL